MGTQKRKMLHPPDNQAYIMFVFLQKLHVKFIQIIEINMSLFDYRMFYPAGTITGQY